MGLIILAITLVLTMVIVRIGALALELTGMAAEMARFQALSAFTGTGFTTRAAEDVVHHPQRRRVVLFLIIIGWATVAVVITGLMQTFRIENFAGFNWLAALKLVAVLLCFYVLYRILVLPRLSQTIDRAIKSHLRRVSMLEPLEVEEILAQQDGWGVAQVEVHEVCGLAGKPLQESRPRDLGILIIAIERGSEYIPSPGPHDVIYVGDKLLAYGPMDAMEQIAVGGYTAPLSEDV